MSPKYCSTFLLHFVGVDVTHHRQHGVRRAVVVLEPLVHIVDAGRLKVVERPDHRPGIGMPLRVGVLEDVQEGPAVGLVLSLPLLVLHDAALLVELRLIDRAQKVSHPVRFHPQRHVERRARDVLEVVRAVEVGGAVHVGGAHPVERLEVVVVEVLAAVEHQVLEQVREARLAELLVLRSDVVPDVHRHDRRLVVLAHDQREPVVEDELLVGDVDLPGREHGQRKKQPDDHDARYLPHHLHSSSVSHGTKFNHWLAPRVAPSPAACCGQPTIGSSVRLESV